MAKKKEKVEEVEDMAEGADVAAPEAVEEAEAEVEETDRDSVTVTWRGGSRTYSREVHGADFKKLAKEFASKRNGEVA